jgi:hypothetical protein
MKQLTQKEIENIIEVFSDLDFHKSKFVRLIFNEHMDLYVLEKKDFGTKLTHHKLICFGNTNSNKPQMNILFEELSSRNIDENQIKEIMFLVEKQKHQNEFEISFYPNNNPITFEQAFMYLYHGKKLAITCGNNRQPEGLAFFMVVDNTKHLGKIFSKLGRKYSYVEIKLFVEKLSLWGEKFIQYLIDENINIEDDNKLLSIHLVKFEMTNNIRLSQEEVLSNLFKETYHYEKFKTK